MILKNNNQDKYIKRKKISISQKLLQLHLTLKLIIYYFFRNFI